MRYSKVTIFLKGQSDFITFQCTSSSDLSDFVVDSKFVSVVTSKKLSDEFGKYIEYTTTSYSIDDVSSYCTVVQAGVDENLPLVEKAETVLDFIRTIMSKQ